MSTVGLPGSNLVMPVVVAYREDFVSAHRGKMPKATADDPYDALEREV